MTGCNGRCSVECRFFINSSKEVPGTVKTNAHPVVISVSWCYFSYKAFFVIYFDVIIGLIVNKEFIIYTYAGTAITLVGNAGDGVLAIEGVAGLDEGRLG